MTNNTWLLLTGNLCSATYFGPGHVLTSRFVLSNYIPKQFNDAETIITTLFNVARFSRLSICSSYPRPLLLGHKSKPHFPIWYRALMSNAQFWSMECQQKWCACASGYDYSPSLLFVLASWMMVGRGNLKARYWQQKAPGSLNKYVVRSSPDDPH